MEYDSSVAKLSIGRDPRQDDRIQTLRGLVCLLVVTHHIIGTDGTHGIQVGAENPLATFNNLLSPVRMPLFTFIAGYVYAMRPILAGGEWSFLLRKFRRLLVPLCTVSFLFLIAEDEAISNGHFALSLSETWRILVFPYAHFWYLQALALIFMGLVLMERAGLLSSARYWLAVFTAAILSYLFIRFQINFFSINGALYLMPFFILGVGFQRFPDLLQSRPLIVLSRVVALTSLVIYFFAITGFLSFPDYSLPILQLAIGLAACPALLSANFECTPLAVLGGFSYAIYLFHIFGTSGMRRLLAMVGVDNVTVLVILGFLAGITLPILIEIVADHFSLAGLLLLGRSPQPGPDRPRAATARLLNSQAS